MTACLMYDSLIIIKKYSVNQVPFHFSDDLMWGHDPKFEGLILLRITCSLVPHTTLDICFPNMFLSQNKGYSTFQGALMSSMGIHFTSMV